MDIFIAQETNSKADLEQRLHEDAAIRAKAIADAKQAAAERLGIEQKITGLAITRAQAKIMAANKARGQLEAEKNAT
ncbi:hypothetical protein [Nitrosomonas nitrosa]|uniref:hypothetical protein n=1 Tax=Nitrosomonas nitrosa TaxID=52442 RepID=UPI0023F8A98B|nr:hypothetical protein [Nitrosomonas nitrosa]MCO6434776.1 hypothetical protein [Nitrosomonas nitrosa]